MATVIFDFDSTLINCESLELILQPILAKSPELQQAFHHITNQGMNGDISFQQSLHQRLTLAAPSLQAVQQFADSATQYLTTGIKELIAALQQHNIAIWIISGGLQQAILPLANQLNIPSEQVLAVQAVWDQAGNFEQLAADDICSQGKVLAAKSIYSQFTQPIIMVGDGITDYEIWQAGFADHFIAYSEHAKRPAVLGLAEYQANSSQDLATLLHKLLGTDYHF
jgi:phosphoserine phosphatase